MHHELSQYASRSRREQTTPTATTRNGRQLRFIIFCAALSFIRHRIAASNNMFIVCDMTEEQK
jgi:hypothetical protein